MKSLTLFSLLLATVPGVALADTTNTLTPDADTFVRFGINQNVNYGTSGVLDLYSYNTARDYFGYVRFDLSAIPDAATLTSATLTFTKVAGGTRGDTMTTARFRVLGLNDVAGNTPQDWVETALTFDNRGAEWTAANTFDGARVTDLDGTAGNEVVNTTSTPNWASISGDNLLAFLTGRLAANNVTFIVDQATTETGKGYAFGSRENTDPTTVPTLVIGYSVVPEPSALAVIGLGLAGYLARRRFGVR